jgi:hypothetical protein
MYSWLFLAHRIDLGRKELKEGAHEAETAADIQRNNRDSSIFHLRRRSPDYLRYGEDADIERIAFETESLGGSDLSGPRSLFEASVTI